MVKALADMLSTAVCLTYEQVRRAQSAGEMALQGSGDIIGTVHAGDVSNKMASRLLLMQIQPDDAFGKQMLMNLEVRRCLAASFTGPSLIMECDANADTVEHPHAECCKVCEPRPSAGLTGVMSARREAAR